jgi:hypothetical protein
MVTKFKTARKLKDIEQLSNVWYDEKLAREHARKFGVKVYRKLEGGRWHLWYSPK